MTVKRLGLAGLTNGSAIGAGTAGTGDTPIDNFTGSGATVSNAGIHGNCMSIPAGSGVLAATWAVSGAPTAYAYMEYFTTDLVASGGVLVTGHAASSTKAFSFDLNSSSKLRLSALVSGANANPWISAAALTVNTNYRVEIKVNGTAWTVAYYLGDSQTPIEQASGTKDSSGLVDVQFGRAGSTSGNMKVGPVGWQDSFAFLGPTALPDCYIFDGSLWVPQNMTLLS